MNFTYFCILSNCLLYIKEAHCKMLEGKKKTKQKNSELPRNVQLLHLKKALRYTYRHAGYPPPARFPFLVQTMVRVLISAGLPKLKIKKK